VPIDLLPYLFFQFAKDGKRMYDDNAVDSLFSLNNLIAVALSCGSAFLKKGVILIAKESSNTERLRYFISETLDSTTWIFDDRKVKIEDIESGVFEGTKPIKFEDNRF
jgi:hypothetical protein